MLPDQYRRPDKEANQVKISRNGREETQRRCRAAQEIVPRSPRFQRLALRLHESGRRTKPHHTQSTCRPKIIFCAFNDNKHPVALSSDDLRLELFPANPGCARALVFLRTSKPVYGWSATEIHMLSSGKLLTVSLGRQLLPSWHRASEQACTGTVTSHALWSAFPACT